MADEHSRWAVLGSVLFYMAVAISMTLLNKSVLSSTPLPVFLLLCQTVIAVILVAAENKFGPVKTPRFDWKVAKDQIPLCLVNVLGLIFNNYCLQYVDASFHQVARGLVLPCTIGVSVLVLHKYPSTLSLTAAFIVTSGFFSGVLFDPNHASSRASAAVASAHGSMIGIIFGGLSSVSSALHAVLIKRGLSHVQGSPIALSYYNNILSAIALVPMLVLTGELPGTITMLGGPEASKFLWGAGITGVFGFLMSFAVLFSIKLTSPVTHMISSAARGVLQTMLAVYFFGDILSKGRVISIMLIISGSMLYVYSKSEESMRPAHVPLDPKALERGGDVGFDEKRGG